ncbi:helix-turn-helix domain-containing protein [Roseomonas aerophila]|uniref:Helix-turn-helix domain-containing protein n=1 Tax=Teichococcus aerophilus TaxID=1224513 RepID=A0ABR7RPQ8_9PROT|nr:IclR family transcriptional regulator C-terminal domain-containing protein [Pseudoroseomonas aerophila]MBC9208336.1 helix-turn-helix domain-containing protein [Pseudoroseomonas aerophila]
MKPDPDEAAGNSGAVARAVPAVTRAVAILRLLSRSEAPLGVHAIARPLGMVPSTCLHILRALVAEELLSVDSATKRYALASGVVALARGMLRNDPFANLAQPVLDRLAAEYGTTAIGVEATGLDHIVALAIARPGHALRLQVDVGSRYPALISATGRCIAAFGDHSWKEMERRFHTLRWENPPSLQQWRDDVQATRESGYAVDEGRYITGVTVIAAPVMPRGRVSHAIVVVGVAEQLRRLGLEDIGTAMRAQAAALSLKLEGA